MKLPNGYGSVYKLKGKRRNPWVARKTIGWKINSESRSASPVYKFVGYYPTREEALTALGAYNSNPYGLEDIESPTFREVYELWSADAFAKVSKSQACIYRTAVKSIEPIMDMPIKDIRLIHLQRTLDAAGKNEPSARRIKTLFKKVFACAVKNEFIRPEKAAIAGYVEVKGSNPDAKPHVPFTREEVAFLWESLTDEYYSPFMLFLIYTGLRLDEALTLRKVNVHLEDRYLEVVKSKTASGIRQVPIAEKIVPIVERLANTKSPYLVKGIKADKITKTNLYKPYYMGVMSHGLDHTPHDARHTCATLLAEAGVDERIIRSILGHAGQGVTEKVYTHISIAVKIEAINKI